MTLKKKNFYFTGLALLIAIVAVFAFVIYSDSTVRIAEDFKNTTIENGFGDDSNFDGLSDEDEITIATALLETGLDKKSSVVGFDSDRIVDVTSEVSQLLSEKNYIEAYEILVSLIDEVNSYTDEYVENNKNEFEQIDEYLKTEGVVENENNFSTINHKIVDGWALVTLDSETRNLDNANVILKKVNGSWEIVAGPGTYFEDGELMQQGVPEEIINSANKIYIDKLI